MCHGGCGVIVYVKDGKVAKIAGDPSVHQPRTICSKGSRRQLPITEPLDHP